MRIALPRTVPYPPPLTKIDGKDFYRINLAFEIDHACLRRQINESVRAMKKDGRMGTDLKTKVPELGLDSIPCLPAHPAGLKGDFDMTVKELVRILYMGTAPGKEILDASTVTHMYEELLAARGEPGNATYSVLSDCDDTAGEDLGSPEDTADREYFYNEIFSAFEDLFDFMADFAIKGATVLLASSGFPPAVLLIPAGGILDMEGSVLTPPFDLRVPETENHRLMIETSRYLTNAAIINRLRAINHENIDEVIEKQDKVFNWLLKDLHRITRQDFDEFNSRPYTRLSLQAILNLYDFADTSTPQGLALHNAARIVLDLSAAKFAVGSNRGRRLAPFRRLADSGFDDLYTLVMGADHEIVRSFVLAGQTQLLPTIPADRTRSMVNSAVSTYRPALPILELAVERKVPFRQTVSHAGLETYYYAPSFTASLGGIQTPPALSAGNFDLFKVTNDRGIALPTAIIPTNSGKAIDDLYIFAGIGTQAERSENICGYKGFICGVKPHFPPLQPPCVTRISTSREATDFVNSRLCKGSQPPHFYLAALTAQCDGRFCSEGQRYGYVEVIDAPMTTTGDAAAFDQQAFRQFTSERRAALVAAMPNADGVGTYRNSVGDLITFRISETRSAIRAINNVTRPPFDLPEPPIYRSYLARGGAINSIGGKATIRSPWSDARVEIDFIDWRSPRISDVKTDASSTVQIYRMKAAPERGALEWHKHLDAITAETGTEGLAGPSFVGDGWEIYPRLIPAIGSAVVYAMEPNGDLWWFRHDGFKDGSPRWSKSAAPIGNGWNSVNKIVAGEDGVLYGRFPDGRVRWYRHLGHADGSVAWAQDREVRSVADGWGRFTDIFAGSGGVLYGIEPNGDLRWHKHNGHLTGENSWAPEVSRVGNGWQNLKGVFSAGRGLIYAIWPTGELVRYNHFAHQTGENRQAPSVIIDTGWQDSQRAFALSPKD